MRLRLAYRCELRWADLPGDARRRHCPQCDTTVVNLAFLSAPEIAALDGKTCVRFVCDADGEAIVAPATLTRRRLPLVASAVAAAALGLAVVAADARADISPPPDGETAEVLHKQKQKRPKQTKREKKPTPQDADRMGLLEKF